MKTNKIIVFLIIVLILIAAGLVYYFDFYQKKNMKEENKITNQTADRLKIEILEKGNGAAAKNGDTIVVHYIGTLENGTKFDSSLDRGRPFSFVLGAGQVIAGWEQGILGMQVGEKAKLTIPPELAYGNQAVGGVIPANSTLVFEVELLEVK